MVTYSSIGSLPIGIVITSDETTSTLIQAFELLKRCLPEDAFFGKGVVGPQVIMTDNCLELRDALNKTWSITILLLCVFHMLQQVWKWIYVAKHGARNSDRAKIINLFRNMLYEKEDDVEMSYDDMITFDVVSKYPNLVTYLMTLYDRKEEWALCYRKHLLIRGNNTNNPVEAQFLVLKDDILNRTKEVNINGL